MSPNSTYARPTRLVPERIQKLRPLVPVGPPEPRVLPPTTLRLPSSHVVNGYLRTSHIVPAASFRSLTEDKSLRQLANSGDAFDAKAMCKALIDAKDSYDTEEMQEKYVGKSLVPQWNCVDRYVRQSPKIDAKMPGITLFLTHASGLHRQTWEPTISHLISEASAASSSVLIDEIWSFECVQHGDSAVLNDNAQRDIFDWRDHSRDILNFLYYYLPSSASVGTLPTLLSAVRHSIENNLRRIVGIGHSYGGTILARAAIENPNLFSNLILVDPIITPTSFVKGKSLDMLMGGSLTKPYSWASRDDARAYFLKSRPMKSWDHAVLDAFVEHGLVEESTGNQTPVRLKARPFDEAVVYCEWSICYEIWAAIADLDPRIHLHWIMSGKSSVTTGGDALTQVTVWRRVQNTTNVRLNASHLIVQEAPKDLSSEIFNFLSKHESQVVSKL